MAGSGWVKMIDSKMILKRRMTGTWGNGSNGLFGDGAEVDLVVVDVDPMDSVERGGGQGAGDVFAVGFCVFVDGRDVPCGAFVQEAHFLGADYRAINAYIDLPDAVGGAAEEMQQGLSVEVHGKKQSPVIEQIAQNLEHMSAGLVVSFPVGIFDLILASFLLSWLDTISLSTERGRKLISLP
jgi:hypothetical protein